MSEPVAWRLVPIEPTYQMCAQGLTRHPFTFPDINTIADSYKAMLQAAPKHEAADEIERKDAAIAELVGVCKEYVHGCETRTAVSTRGYEQMKAVIAKYDK